MSALWRGHKFESTGPAIMESLDSMCICNRDVQPSNQDSVFVNEVLKSGLRAKCQCDEFRSFLLIDGQEILRVSSAEHFIGKLNCSEKNIKVKVISIFGNTGDGKSHTLNQTFFNGEEVFKTSNEQSSCTLGVWAAFDPALDVICLDTEGLLGTIKCFCLYDLMRCMKPWNNDV